MRPQALPAKKLTPPLLRGQDDLSRGLDLAVQFQRIVHHGHGKRFTLARQFQVLWHSPRVRAGAASAILERAGTDLLVALNVGTAASKHRGLGHKPQFQCARLHSRQARVAVGACEGHLTGAPLRQAGGPGNTLRAGNRKVLSGVVNNTLPGVTSAAGISAVKPVAVSLKMTSAPLA